MDASSKIQRSIHDVRLTYKYVSRMLGTYQTRAAIFVFYLLLLEEWESEEDQQKHLQMPHMEMLKQIKEKYVLDTAVTKR